MQFIDSHTHLYLSDFDDDRSALISDAEKKGINTFLLPHIDSETTSELYKLVHDDPQRYYAMMGLHPCSVKENYADELTHVRRNLENEKNIAVGEIGMDLYWDKTFVKQQEETFIKQIHWADEFDLPIVIHSRETIDILIELIKKESIKDLKGVFHCFTGSIEQAKQIFDLGMLLGIGGVVTFKNSGLDKTLAELPLDKIILETDSPYLAPAPNRGKKNIPEYLYLVAEKVAEVYDIDIKKVAEQTTFNCKELFKLK
ncbi:MAG: TatD family hydrolase [Bacteroidia bacterium]|nr:TatD family hydrolase [Bacteroidia bacterium]